jgi:serine/threonine protein kinase
MKRLSESETILCTSLSGYITKSGFKPYTVSKPIHFAREEMILNDTSDCFGFYRYPSLPRNWKKKTNEEPSEHFPNLPGINSQREIALNQYLKGRPFCTYLYHVVVYNKEQTDTTHAPGPEPTPHSPETLTLQAFAQKVFEARMYPEKIVKLIQMDAGVTFEYWAEYVCASKEEFVQVTDRVEAILAELRLEGIVHADPHPRNVLIDCTSDRKVSLIDFGWSLMRGFQMCAVEQQAFNHMIQSNFDLHHFRQSLEFCKATNMWLKK